MSNTASLNITTLHTPHKLLQTWEDPDFPSVRERKSSLKQLYLKICFEIIKLPL